MLKQFLLNPCHVLIDGLFESVPILLSFMVISFGASEKETGMILSLAIMVSTFLGLSTAFFSRHVGLLPTFSLIILLPVHIDDCVTRQRKVKVSLVLVMGKSLAHFVWGFVINRQRCYPQ